MACALLDTVLGKLGEEGKPAYEVLETYKGTDLEGKEYEPLYQCAADAAAKQKKKAFYVTCDTYVTLTDGTESFTSRRHLVKTMPMWEENMIFRLYSWWTRKEIWRNPLRSQDYL